MPEMDRRIALLRLLMIDLSDRERQAHQAVEQLRAQLPRIVDFAVRHNTSVPSALSSLADVEARLREQEDVTRHLRMLRERAQSELDALLVTRGVTDAHARLAELTARRARLLAALSPSPADVGAPNAAPAPSTDAPAEEPPAEVSQLYTSQPLPELAAIDQEIAELRAAILSASDAAARALTPHEPLAHASETHDDDGA